MGELQLEVKKHQWLAALRWRQHMNDCLALAGLTFTEWLVLDAIWCLVDRTGTTVSQDEIAAELELDTMTLWHSMAVLEHRGLVTRTRTMSGTAWRILVSSEGSDLLRAVKPSLEAVSSSPSQS